MRRRGALWIVKSRWVDRNQGEKCKILKNREKIYDQHRAAERQNGKK